MDEESAGQRLDNFLIRQLKGVPKTHVYRIIRSGEVRVNKGRAAADTRVAAGDVVRLPPVRISENVAEKLRDSRRRRANSRVLSRGRAPDRHRQAGRRGGARRQRRELRRHRAVAPGPARGASFLELVHRLDRETSGILLVAKKRSALMKLQDQFRERETGKTYLALVVGTWPANKKVIDVPLHKYLQADGERRVKVVAKDDPDGMRSITLVKVQGRHTGDRPRPPAFTLLEVTIKTGRTHQIRVHLASPGPPDRRRRQVRRLRAQQGLAKARASSACSCTPGGYSSIIPRPASASNLLAALPPELKKFADHAHRRDPASLT